MNSTWNIMVKDLTRLRWPLLLWAVAGILAVSGLNLAGYSRGAWDQVGIFALFQFGGLTLALIAAVVQQDDPNGSKAFWRTRPIAGARLLTAKLLLILPVFVGVPFIALVIVHATSLGASRLGPESYFLPFVTMFGVALSCAALASCTSTLARYFLLLILGWMLIWVLIAVVQIWIQPVRGGFRLENSRTIVQAIVVGSLAAGVLFNQYLSRRLILSIVLLVGAVLGAVVIRIGWPWTFV